MIGVPRQILPPFVTLAEIMVGNDIEMATAGRRWLSNELHVGFPRRSARLTAITGDAGADDIFPGMLTTTITWYDMVEG